MGPTRGLAVVLVSGGMDSCVALAEARASGHDAALLHVSYGQRTAVRERQAFERIGDYYGVPARHRLVCTLPHLADIGGSALTDTAIPVGRAEFLPGRIPQTYVPFRNAHMLCAGVAWGEVLGAEALYIGAVEEDSSGYPDCREVFLDAFNRVIETGTRPETRLRVRAPLLHMRKSQIVRRGIELAAPLHLTWSCYEADELACGVCESCLLRLRGFAEAEAEDPIPYRGGLPPRFP